MFDFSDAGINGVPDPRYQKTQIFAREVYNIPFVINDIRNRALIVGSGTGNDIQAALRNGYRQVYAIDIDSRIMELGRRLHPERPYDDARVTPIVNDARAFFEQYKGDRFDVICYGFLDSHAMFSSMSSLRLDNFVYTEEGIRSAWEHLSDKGHLCITFSVFGGKWISERLYWTIAGATGQKPAYLYHGLFYGATYIASRDMSRLKLDLLAQPALTFPDEDKLGVVTTSDDWPFLYINHAVFPWGYVIVLSVILILAFISTSFVFGAKSLRKEFDLALFCMGAAFLLIETRGVTSLSLLFGSTWIVNFFVFLSILVTVLVANLFVLHFKYKNPLPWFGLLFISVIFLWIFKIGYLNQFPLLIRGLIGGIINALPIGFAGIIVSIFLSRSSNPSASLGSNLLGTVFGGCIEYLSICFGLRALVLIALFCYIIALVCFYIREKRIVIQS
jgi:SAM-dependent methyltransferase